MENKQTEQKGTDVEKPPVLSSWNRLYSLVLLNLVFLIVLLYIFTQAFK